MSVVSVWVGATTPSTATVVAKVTGSSVRLAVDDNSALISPTFFGPVTPSAQGIVRIAATGLSANTRYHFAIEDTGVLDSTFRGQFLTHPPVGQPASFTVGMASCAGHSSAFPGVGNVLVSDKLSNHPVFDDIRSKALAEDWLLFIHGGDMNYYDIGSGVHVPNHDLATFRRAYDDVLRQPRQHQMYRNLATVYMYDDHDYGPNDSDRTAPGRGNSIQVYRERVPHYPRGTSDPNRPNHQSFQIGRVLFVIWDVRADRDPQTDPQSSTKTMLGTTQKAWFKSLLETSTARYLVVVNTSQWENTTYIGGWSGYTHERNEIVSMLAAPGGDPAKSWLPRMCILQGDQHAIGLSSTTLWGGFPIFQFAPLDSSTGAVQSSLWDFGTVSERASYGTLTIDDNGSILTVTARGWTGAQEVVKYSYVVPEEGALPATVQATQPSLYSATNNTFGTASPDSEYRDCGVVFTAPPSGRVTIYWSGGLRNLDSDGSAVAYLSPEVRTGGVVGSGSLILAGHDNRTVRTNLGGIHTARAGAAHVLSGLTAGATYNVRLLHRVTSSTGVFFQRGLIVESAP